MGYYNPIYIYGVDRFLADAKAAGVDGLIVVDLPPEEDDELCMPALKAGLNFIRLATPTTDDKRLPAVLANTSGFVYYVSVTGITGSGQRRHRAWSARPSPASSGIPTCRSASASASGRRRRPRRSREIADGVVVGSALVDALRASLDAEGRATAKTVGAVPIWWRRWRRACGEPSRLRNKPQLRGARAAACRATPNRHISSRCVNRISERTMNWLTNVVRPKIATSCAARRRRISGSSARIPAS